MSIEILDNQDGFFDRFYGVRFNDKTILSYQNGRIEIHTNSRINKWELLQVDRLLYFPLVSV